ncbi:MAG: response regulator transcription factor [Acidobacteria bacterium]|nr:response regulator transcription factor [Acidobacteriota bacterium]
MMRAYIVDDERLAVSRLERLLVQTGRVQVIGTQTDPEAALDAIRGVELDVLFLDIQMPGLSGFDLLEQLAAPVPVIFTTAYDEHALRAFTTNSIDYLLKPVALDRLEQALDKLQRLTRGAGQPDVRALARELAVHLGHPRRLERIASRSGERTLLLDVTRVSHFVARDKLTFALVNGREHVIEQSLTELEAQLDPRRFVRIHRSTVVNTTFIGELHADVDGGLIVRLRDEPKTELGVARDRTRLLKERLGI